MSQTPDSPATSGPPRADAWGAYEQAARAAAGLDALAPSSAGGTGGDVPAGVDAAAETAGTGPTNDSESIHGDVPGFVDNVDSPAGPGPSRQGVEE